MKKISIIVVLFLILLAIIFFFPKKFTKVITYMVPQQYSNICKGFYIETFNRTSVDGGRGGLCFGIVIKKENPKRPCPKGWDPNVWWCYKDFNLKTTKPKEVNVNKSVIIKRVGEREGSFLVQKINEDNVVGLWYEKYPVQDSRGVVRTLHIGDDIGYACEGISEILTNIDFTYQGISFTKTIGPKPKGGCPL